MFDKGKEHFKKHKEKYLIGGGCLIVGGIAGSILASNSSIQIVDSLKVQLWSPTTNIALQRAACPEPIPVLDKTTGEAYRSMRRAAAVTGETLSSISNDANGSNARFEILPPSVFA